MENAPPGPRGYRHALQSRDDDCPPYFFLVVVLTTGPPQTASSPPPAIPGSQRSSRWPSGSCMTIAMCSGSWPTRRTRDPVSPEDRQHCGRSSEAIHVSRAAPFEARAFSAFALWAIECFEEGPATNHIDGALSRRARDCMLECLPGLRNTSPEEEALAVVHPET